MASILLDITLAMIFGSGMPLMYGAVLVGMTMHLNIDRHILLRCARKPNRYSPSLPRLVGSAAPPHALDCKYCWLLGLAATHTAAIAVGARLFYSGCWAVGRSAHAPRWRWWGVLPIPAPLTLRKLTLAHSGWGPTPAALLIKGVLCPALLP